MMPEKQGYAKRVEQPRNRWRFLPHGGACLAEGTHLFTAGIGVLTAETETPGELSLYRVDDGEVLEDHDLAILKTEVYSSEIYRWSTADPTLLEEVRTFGYPYAYDALSGTLNVRGFKGEIVGGDTLTRLAANPPISELSFPCPRGLSGAPLIRKEPEPCIVGIVLGNQITEMTVFQEKETLAEGSVEKTLIKTEALHLGIALRASTAVTVHSRLLGCTIGDWLRRCGVLLEQA